MDAVSGWFQSGKDFLNRELGGLSGSFHFGSGAPAGGSVSVGAPAATNVWLMVAGVAVIAFLLGSKKAR